MMAAWSGGMAPGVDGISTLIIFALFAPMKQGPLNYTQYKLLVSLNFYLL